MKIISISLKEKSVKIEKVTNFNTLTAEIKRNNLMPITLDNDTLNCIIELDVTIKNEKKENLLISKIAYIVSVKDISNYEQNNTADEIFEKLYYMYYDTINNLLQEVNFPPIPLTVFEKKMLS